MCTHFGRIMYHAAHADGKWHSSVRTTMGRGVMISTSKKLGLAANIYGESKIASDGELFPKHALFRHFILDQCDGTKEHALTHDSKGCALACKNCPCSTCKDS